MIRFDRFPEGKTHAVTFSFDDGRSEDIKLAKLFEKYALKSTFHINSGKLDKQGYLSTSQVNQISQYHEIAIHSENHARLINCTSVAVVQEVLRDRLNLEEKIGKILKGFSYPFGDLNDVIYHSISTCGIEYARTTNSTHCFGLPEDFLLWRPTCHIYEVFKDLTPFLERLPNLGQNPLFLIWGHSFELERDNRWGELELFLHDIAGREEIWYTTCGDIYSYVQAMRNVRVSADENMIENPSSRSVWISFNKKPIEIQGGECLKLR